MASQENIDEWFALYVKPRHEKAVSRFLHANGWNTFLPLYVRRHVYTDRCKENELPLFPGYVFCRFNPFNRLTILTAPGVLSIVGIGKRPVSVGDGEILALQGTINKHLTPEPCDFLQEGQRVRIMRGALSGIEGVIVESKNSLRLVLSITLLQRSVQFQLDRSRLDVCDPPTIVDVSRATLDYRNYSGGLAHSPLLNSLRGYCWPWEGVSKKHHARSIDGSQIHYPRHHATQ